MPNEIGPGFKFSNPHLTLLDLLFSIGGNLLVFLDPLMVLTKLIFQKFVLPLNIPMSNLQLPQLMAGIAYLFSKFACFNTNRGDSLLGFLNMCSQLL